MNISSNGKEALRLIKVPIPPVYSSHSYKSSFNIGLKPDHLQLLLFIPNRGFYSLRE